MNAAALAVRAREVKARSAVRGWEYRQRNHAKGVWMRLARLLAGAESAWAIPCESAAVLVSERFVRVTVGDELQPPRTILVVSAERIAAITGARKLEVRLSAELLAVPCVALVPFAGQSPTSP